MRAQQSAPRFDVLRIEFVCGERQQGIASGRHAEDRIDEKDALGGRLRRGGSQLSTASLGLGAVRPDGGDDGRQHQYQADDREPHRYCLEPALQAVFGLLPLVFLAVATAFLLQLLGALAFCLRELLETFTFCVLGLALGPIFSYGMGQQIVRQFDPARSVSFVQSQNSTVDQQADLVLA